MPEINKTVLVSGADFFTDKDAINALMDSAIPVNLSQAIDEHQSIVEAFKAAGIKVIKVDPPSGCQDGIYTANWGLVKDGQVLLSRLPNKRKAEEPRAKEVLSDLGLKTLELPSSVRAFSGQGDALVCGDTVFCQSPYRTSADAHIYLQQYLGFKQVISLQTKPIRSFKVGPAKLNELTGWPDSPTYDLDLAIAILRPATESTLPLIAYCPEVFKRASKKRLKKLPGFDKIIVSKAEALDAYATNLVSTGDQVIMNAEAPELKAELIKRGFQVTELSLPELKKGGGSIRCCSLTID